ncbi:MAG: DUF3592 domain-containing protein [Anaerolineales bacterium]|jgi:hypothetical protein
MTAYLIILAIGVIAVAIIGYSILRGQRSRSWPQVTGSVLSSSISTHESTDDDGSTTTTYGVDLIYRYSVGGQEYQGTRRTFTDVATSSRKRAVKILESYPQGATVMVYYDPQKPSSCVLEPGVGWISYLFLALGFVFLLFGLAGVLGLFG